jgi:hypothetical protein
MKTNTTAKIGLTLILAVFWGVSPVFGADLRTSPIDVNLIIDGSGAISPVMDEVSAWISGKLLDTMLIDGDRLTVWSAGASANIIFSGALQGETGKEQVKKAIAGLSPAGETPNFSGALREAAARSSAQTFSYTLLVSASAAALSPTLLGPEAPLLRFSRLEEHRSWRTMIIGLNLNARVRQAAAAYMGT